MRRVVALVGLSGVGKSTLVRRVQAFEPLLHLQASNIIKAEQARRRANVSTSDELRLGPVLENQQLLIDGFIAATRDVSGLVVFDGHAVIFGEAGAIEISSTVFAALDSEVIIVIEADPITIRAQRLRDATRVRPDIDEAGLRRQQAHAKGVALRIAAELGIPVRCVAAANSEDLLTALRLPANGGPAETAALCGA